MVETFCEAINFNDLKDSGSSTFNPDKRLRLKEINPNYSNKIAVLLSYDHLLKEKQSGITEFSEILKERGR